MIKKLLVFIILMITPFIVLALPKGDINGDNKVDSYDYALMRNHIRKKTLLTGNELKRADVDGKDEVNSMDYVLLRNIIIANLKPNSTVTPIPTVTPKPTSTSLTEAEKICESVKNNSSIDYKSFLSLSKKASNGDKYKDDYYAINAAHKCANKYNKPVKVTKSTYHIYKKNKDTISVQTNTDFNDSTIYIHNDEDIYNYMKTNIFTIKTNNSNECIKGTKTGFTNAFSSLASSSGKYYIKVTELDGVKILNRNKGNKDKKGKYYTEQETAKSDVYRLYNGVVQDPMFWNYNNSKIEYEVCPIPTDQLVFQNAIIKSVVKADCKKCTGSDESQDFKKRGIAVKRSNTKLYNIHHSFVNTNFEYTHEIHHKFTGFFTISAADVILEKCTVYSMWFKLASGKHGSTYDISIGNAVNVTLNKVKMSKEDKNYNQLKSSNDWGVMASNRSKNITVINSELNRIDAHKAMLNLTVKDSIVGSKGMTMVGTGDNKNNKMVIENVTWKYTYKLISLRGDYGGTWNGTISIKNSKVQNATSSTVSVVAPGGVISNMNPDLVFNQPIYNPTKVTINGLKINSSNVSKLQVFSASKSEMTNYYMKHFQRKSNKNEETGISKKNITGVKTVVNYAG